jgi:hypothetical protein
MRILLVVFAGEPQMLTVVNTISLAIARMLMKTPALLSRVRQSVAQAQADRARIEAALFHGRYRLSLENNDDLPLAG